MISNLDYTPFLKNSAWRWIKKLDKSKLSTTGKNLQAMFDEIAKYADLKGKAVTTQEKFETK